MPFFIKFFCHFCGRKNSKILAAGTKGFTHFDWHTTSLPGISWKTPWAFIKPLETSSSAPAWRRWPGHSERWRSAKVCFTFLLLSFWVSENISLHTISWHNIFIIIAFGYWMLLMLSFVIYSWFKNIVAEAVDSRATGLCSFLSTHSEPNVVVIDTPNWNKLRCYCNERRTAVATSTPFWNLAI